MSELIETLAPEPERPREVTRQVARHLGGNYGIAEDEIGPFLLDTLPTLEEDEVDLILSPLFTPKLGDQAVFAARLGRESVGPDSQARLVAQALARPTDARLVTGDEHACRVRLGEVTVERYVYRLRLEGTIPEPVFALIDRFPSADQPLLGAVARRAIWEGDSRSGILEACFEAAARRGGPGAGDFPRLLDLVERYKPASLPDLIAKMPAWQEGLRGDLGIAAGGKPFFSPGIERDHGGEHDRRLSADALIEAKREELAFLARLEQLLAG
jgi:hypothetical protein